MEQINSFVSSYCPHKKPFYLTFNADRHKERNYYNTPVIYLLICTHTIVYVGYTKSLPIRLTAHRSSKKVFDRICIIPFSKDEVAQTMEQIAITYFIPKYNKLHKPLPPKAKPTFSYSSVIVKQKKPAIFTKQSAKIYIKKLNNIA